MLVGRSGELSLHETWDSCFFVDGDAGPGKEDPKRCSVGQRPPQKFSANHDSGSMQGPRMQCHSGPVTLRIPGGHMGSAGGGAGFRATRRGARRPPGLQAVTAGDHVVLGREGRSISRPSRFSHAICISAITAACCVSSLQRGEQAAGNLVEHAARKEKSRNGPRNKAGIWGAAKFMRLGEGP